MPDKIDQINKLIKTLPLPKKGLYKLKDNINLDDYIAILQSKRENKTYTIDASELGGSGTGIQSLTAGDNITIDDTDPLNPIVSASSGGTPAGSDTQIQYNNAGAFGASSDFTWDNTNKLFIAGDFGGTANHTYIEVDDTSSLFYVNGLQNTVPVSTTTPVFTGSGLDDLTPNAGAFVGTTLTSYSVTIDGVNKDFLVVQTFSIVGSGFIVGEAVTGPSGSATIDGINVDANTSITYLTVSGLTGTFSSSETITGSTSGTTGTLNAGNAVSDTYSWTDGTNNASFVPMQVSYSLSFEMIINWGADSGHTLSDNWTFDVTPASTTYGKMLNLDGVSRRMSIGDINGIGNLTLLEVRDDSSLLRLNSKRYVIMRGLINDTNITIDDVAQSVTTASALTSFSTQSFTVNGPINGTGMTIDDATQLITLTNVPTYADDAAAATGGLTTGQLYKTTTGGITALNIVP